MGTESIRSVGRVPTLGLISATKRLPIHSPRTTRRARKCFVVGLVARSGLVDDPAEIPQVSPDPDDDYLMGLA